MTPPRARFPCRHCFLQCEPYNASSKTSRIYPCRDSLRVWAGAHRDDPGDEDGYVWERDDERGSR